MNFTKAWLCVVLSSLCLAQGPPNYSGSRQDLAIVQPVSPAPLMPAAGSTVTPADFNNPIVRLTDVGTGSLGGYNVTPSGADADQIFNTDSTFIIVTTNGGGTRMVIGFDPVAMKPTGVVPGFKLGGMFAWSQIDPKVLYRFIGTKFVKYTFTDTKTVPTSSLLFDFNGCPGFGPITGYSAGHLKTDSADSVISTIVSAGGQDSAVNVIAYNLVTGKCSFYNTSTGQVGGNWGQTGAASDQARYRMHESYLSKAGMTAIIMAVGSCTAGDCLGIAQNTYFWTPGTTTVKHAASGTGHNVVGFNHYLNFVAFPWTAVQDMNTGARLSNWPGPNPSVPQAKGGAHMSWNNATSDTSPVFVSTTSTPTNPTVYTCPLVNEIYARLSDGTYRRFAHTYVTGTNVQNFYDAQAIGSVSQDGRFFAWTSDWGGTLGTLGNGALRADVFVVKLQ